MSQYAVIVSARMSSTRLPGKALISYCPDGTTNLEQIIARWQASRRQPIVVVATSDGMEDAPIAALCERLSVPCYRGSRDDVVSRMDGALREFAPNASHIARALADNPLVDTSLADWRLDVLAETGADGLWYGGDEHRLTYAATTDAWSRSAWDVIAERSSGSQREHPGAYFWDNLSQFSVVQLPLPAREYLASVRTELDTLQDLEMFKRLWALWQENEFDAYTDAVNRSAPCLGTLRALDYLAAYPEVVALNSSVELKTQTRATWPKGQSWLCRSCQRRAGGVVAGDLEVRCGRCGSPQKFYAQKPKRMYPRLAP